MFKTTDNSQQVPYNGMGLWRISRSAWHVFVISKMRSIGHLWHASCQAKMLCCHWGMVFMLSLSKEGKRVSQGPWLHVRFGIFVLSSQSDLRRSDHHEVEVCTARCCIKTCRETAVQTAGVICA